VNCELFKPCARNEARQTLGFALDERIVLFNVGYRAKLKGRELYDAALRIARSELPAIRSVVLDGSAPSERVPLYMNAADCLVVASVFEGSPNIVKEAMACNLPVASVDVGDVAERLRMVSPSRIVKRDAGELGHAIVELLALQTRSNGREQILSTCSEDRIAAVIRAVYDSVLQNGAGLSTDQSLSRPASRAASGNI
jgi:glycosyltransferase involved in cell wall biosynthesis